MVVSNSLSSLLLMALAGQSSICFGEPKVSLAQRNLVLTLEMPTSIEFLIVQVHGRFVYYSIFDSLQSEENLKTANVNWQGSRCRRATIAGAIPY